MNEKLAITLAKRQGWAQASKGTLQSHLNAQLGRMMSESEVWITLHVRHKGRKVRRRVSLSRYTQMLAQEIERRVVTESRWNAYQSFVAQILTSGTLVNVPSKMFFVGTPRSYGKSIVNMIYDEVQAHER